MKRQNGFTLIEVLAAVTVLSVTAGILLRVFVTAGRISQKSLEDEKAAELAMDAIELLKACPIEDMARRKTGMEEEWMIGGEKWTVAKEDGVFLFSREAGPYIVEIKADYKKYEEGEDGIPGVNSYEMPRIEHISSEDNVVITPYDLQKEEESLENRLAEKLEAIEEEEEETDREAAEEADGETRKILHIVIGSAEGENEMTVSAQLIDTAAPENTAPDRLTEDFGELTAMAGIYSALRAVRFKEGEDGIKNTIYLFLPEENHYESLWISAAGRSDGFPYRLYLIVPEGEEQGDFLDYVFFSEDRSREAVVIFSNLPSWGKEQGFIDTLPAQNRIYGLTASVYEWVTDSSGKKEKGEMKFTMDSSKRE